MAFTDIQRSTFLASAAGAVRIKRTALTGTVIFSSKGNFR
jgi:hypothetical protein